MDPDRRMVVFVGADRVLLDQPRRSVAAAVSALELLAREPVPLVLCSTQTRATLEYVCQDLGIRHPFICERGGAVCVPRGYFDFDVPNARHVAGCEVVEFGKRYAEVVELLHHTADRMGIEIRGLSDMPVDEVARDCGLPLLQAHLAKLREYGELFRILDPSPAVRDRLFRGLRAARLRCIGGDPYHYVGGDVDAGGGVELLCALYRRAHGDVLTFAVVDATGDRSLLQLVDCPVVVKDDDLGPTPIALENGRSFRVTEAAGIAGWAEAIAEIARVDPRHETGGETLIVRGQENRG